MDNTREMPPRATGRMSQNTTVSLVFGEAWAWAGLCAGLWVGREQSEHQAEAKDWDWS